MRSASVKTCKFKTSLGVFEKQKEASRTKMGVWLKRREQLGVKDAGRLS